MFHKDRHGRCGVREIKQSDFGVNHGRSIFLRLPEPQKDLHDDRAYQSACFNALCCSRSVMTMPDFCRFNRIVGHGLALQRSPALPDRLILNPEDQGYA